MVTLNMPTILFFLSSGLFLGWSLGANDAANVFGTAVSSRMISFKSAAIICSIFVLIGAVVSGAGGAHTLGKLGQVNTLAGSFIVALSAALTVLFMTKAGLPVSTSQAIVGGIIGWNFFADKATDVSTLQTIVGTWFLCPLLAMAFSIIIYQGVRFFYKRMRVHLLWEDYFTRVFLLIIGAFGAYSLGANNIANVVGVFLPSSPFVDVNMGLFTFSKAQILFLLGGIAIGVGVFTYSQKVMLTVGKGIFRLSPITGLVVVFSSSLVLFVFSSKGLNYLLVSLSLPKLPHVPLSSSQAVVGAVLGIGMCHNIRNVDFRLLGRILIGWILTPVASAIVSFVFLYFMQNVFMSKVFL